jgi:hypothetical protein
VSHGTQASVPATPAYAAHVACRYDAALAVLGEHGLRGPALMRGQRPLRQGACALTLLVPKRQSRTEDRLAVRGTGAILSAGEPHLVTIGSRLRTALVYFGLRDDPRLSNELDAGPIGGWRAVALLVALVLGIAIAIGVFALAGARITWPRLLRGVVLGAVVSSVAIALGRRRGRTRR